MAEDRFANVFTARLNMSSANGTDFVEMSFGMSLRDRIAIVIDELYFYPDLSAVSEMTTDRDSLQWAITVSDQVTALADMTDRRIIYGGTITRGDFGTAASAEYLDLPTKVSFAPPLLILPTRVFFGGHTIGLASAANFTLRMHYRTVNITQDQQLLEVLETFQLST